MIAHLLNNTIAILLARDEVPELARWLDAHPTSTLASPRCSSPAPARAVREGAGVSDDQAPVHDARAAPRAAVGARRARADRRRRRRVVRRRGSHARSSSSSRSPSCPTRRGRRPSRACCCPTACGSSMSRSSSARTELPGRLGRAQRATASRSIVVPEPRESCRARRPLGVRAGARARVLRRRASEDSRSGSPPSSPCCPRRSRSISTAGSA